MIVTINIDMNEAIYFAKVWTFVESELDWRIQQ